MNAAPSNIDDELIDAASSGDLNAVLSALAQGASPDARKSHTGMTALGYATSARSLTCVQALLDAGAHVNRRIVVQSSNGDRTALNIACRQQAWDIIPLLLEKGADPRITTDLHETPAHILLSFVVADLKQAGAVWPKKLQRITDALRLLMRSGNPTNVRSVANETLLSMVTRNIGANGRHDALLPICEILLHHKADPNQPGKDGATPLRRLWRANSISFLRMIVAAGGNLNAKDNEGASVLRNADDVESLRTMIELGADISQVDDLGQNPLLRQLRDEWPQISPDLEERLALLIEHGTDPHLDDYTGESFAQILVELGSVPAQRLTALIAAKQARDAMHSVIQSPRRRPTA